MGWLWSTHNIFPIGTEDFFTEAKESEVKMSIHLHLVLRLSLYEATKPTVSISFWRGA
jgi:hypothetical protein